MTDRLLPLFPLGVVLFPHAFLPLHVFEPRYRALMHDCLGGEPDFGVVLIERGSEVGGGDSRFATGTVARIVQAAELPDGRWVLNAVGTSRFDVAGWLEDDPYPRAMVTAREEAAVPDSCAGLLAETEAAVRRALALKEELTEPAVPASVALADDPTVRAWQLAAIAPLGPVDHQVLLGVDEPATRLAELARMVAEVAGVLAYRLSEG